MKNVLSPFVLAGITLVGGNVHADVLIHDDFSDGSTHGWRKGSPTIPITVETEENGNKYLKLKTALPPDNDTKVAFHTSPGPWQGNYNKKGAKSIMARFNNRGTTPLEMHVAFRTELADLSSRYVTIKGAAIPADKQWHDAIFSIEDADIQMVNKKGHGGSDLTMTPKQTKNYVIQIRFSNGTLGQPTSSGHEDHDHPSASVYTGWNDGNAVDTELWIDDIKLSTDSASATTHMH